LKKTRFYQDIYRTGKKEGERSGEKKGKKAFILKKIQRFNKMNEYRYSW